MPHASMDDLPEVFSELNAGQLCDKNIFNATRDAEQTRRITLLNQKITKILGIAAWQAQAEPPAIAYGKITGQGSHTCHARNIDDLTGDHLLVPGVHQLVSRPQCIGADSGPDIAVEGIPFDLIPYDIELSLVQSLQSPDLMTEVVSLQFSSLQLQPWSVVAALEGNRPLP